MKQYKFKLLTPVFLMVALIFGAPGCNIDDIPNPNGSSIEGFLVDASKSELQTLVAGTEALLRTEIGFYYDVTSIIGRDYYFFTGSDPRYTGELLGKGDASLDNAGFYGTRPYAGRYKTVKNANILIDATNNSTMITSEEANGYLGFAKTVQAYELHLALNLQYNNGIRLDVSDPNALGSFVSYNDALTGIMSLLNDADGDLGAAGSDFAFSLSGAMAGFDTPATFRQFNRALAARIALYMGNKAGALSNLSGSFADPAGDLTTGPGRYYSLAGGDLANNVFRVPNQADAIIAHPSFVADLEAGDDRASKIALRESTLALDGLEGDYDVVVFTSQEDPIPYINNEELILISAEANVGTDNATAATMINVIRNAHGVGDYSGGTSDGELMDEIVHQRRYSLYGLGHRWVDMRRLGRLGELPLDRVGDDVWEEMPRPVTENE